MRSNRIWPFALLLALLMGVVSTPSAVFAQDTKPADSDEAAMASPPAFIEDYLQEFDRVQQQILSLAEAMPAEKYTWRPSEGVRSVSEVYLHTAFANFMLPSVAGHAVPADLADKLGIDKIQSWDTQTTDKAAVNAQVSRSFGHLRSVVSGITAADLDTMVEFFGQKATTRQLLMLALGHLHEHLGQSIAYARMNGIAPPWSQAQQQAQEEAAAASEEP